MKVKIKATGEILNTAAYWRVTTEHCDSRGTPTEYNPEEVEFLSDETASSLVMPAQKDIDWEQRRYEIAKDCLAYRIEGEHRQIIDIIQGQSESDATCIIKQMMGALIKSSVVYADELIKQLKDINTES